MLVGMAWALLAPLLLLIPVAVLVRWMQHRNWPAQARRRWPLALGTVATLVLAVWLPQRWQFAQLCNDLGPPQILQTAQADGFFLDDTTANSFGMRYLQAEGFAWLEARSIDKRDAYTRYTREADGRITSTETGALTAAYRLQATNEDLPGGTHVQRLALTRIDTGALLASAASAHFQGGHARWVLGMWGSATCPTPVTPAGSRTFQKTRHLARDALRPGGAPSAASAASR
jgi:hypothetical protein